jgi:hypothetical protein
VPVPISCHVWIESFRRGTGRAKQSERQSRRGPFVPPGLVWTCLTASRRSQTHIYQPITAVSGRAAGHIGDFVERVDRIKRRKQGVERQGITPPIKALGIRWSEFAVGMFSVQNRLARAVGDLSELRRVVVDIKAVQRVHHISIGQAFQPDTLCPPVKRRPRQHDLCCATTSAGALRTTPFPLGTQSSG